MSITTAGVRRVPASALGRLARWLERVRSAIVHRTVGRPRGFAIASGRDLHRALGDPRAYREQIDRLHERHLLGGGLYELTQDGVSLGTVVMRRDEIARLLARTVASGTYRPQPARLRTIRVNGKARVVFALPLADVIVHGVVSRLIESAAADRLSPNLYSYREGIPWWRAATGLATYVRGHRRIPGVRDGGVYVLRRDVNAYTDSIPVDTASPVWPILQRAVDAGGAGQGIDPGDWDLIEHVVRPEIEVPDGTPVRRDSGVPTGQPISCVLFNLYLADMDRELSSIPGAFYARYSDDMAFAHPDPAVARRAAALIVEHLAALGLKLKQEKSRDLFLTVAGRPSDAWPEARGANAVTFLGLKVNADGTLGLDRVKARGLVRDVERRAQAAVDAAADPEEAGRLAAAVIRQAIDPDDPDASLKTASLIRWIVTDRRQLAELDHRIARAMAGVLTNDRSIRAFRRMPPRLLRERYGLPSLVALRNQVGRPRRARRTEARRGSGIGGWFRRRSTNVIPDAAAPAGLEVAGDAINVLPGG